MAFSDPDNYSYDYMNSSDCEQDASAEIQSVVLPLQLYLLFCLGLLGNVTVLWVLLRYVKLKTMTDVCLLNLALSDLVVAVSLPLWAQHSQDLVSCKLMMGVYQLGFYSSTLFVTLMSADRYLAIVHAVSAMRARTLRYGIIATAAVWLAAAVLASPQVAFASMVDEHCEPEYYPEEWVSFWRMQRNLSENAVGLFLCLPVMVFCNAKILAVLSRSRNSKRHKAVKLILLVVCVFAVCWVPYNVIVFLKTLQMFDILNDCQSWTSINTAQGFAEMVALAHCCLNPLIYAFVGEKFRKWLGVMVRCDCRGEHGRSAALGLRDTSDRETSNTPVRSDY